MKRAKFIPLVALTLIPFFFQGRQANAQKADEKGSQAVGYARKLPNFSIPDPNGKRHTRASVLKSGLVLVVTAPTLSQKDRQEGWAKVLTDSRSGARGLLVYLEDMQPSAFKNEAKSKMKEKFDPGKEPLILIDDEGTLRQALNVPKEDTVVLVYDRRGRLVISESGKPSAEGAAAVWNRLKGAR